MTKALVATKVMKANEICLMERLGGQCCKAYRQCTDWVKCDKCHAWYHCICIGISESFFKDQDGENTFICCQCPSPNNL